MDENLNQVLQWAMVYINGKIPYAIPGCELSDDLDQAKVEFVLMPASSSQAQPLLCYYDKAQQKGVVEFLGKTYYLTTDKLLQQYDTRSHDALDKYVSYWKECHKEHIPSKSHHLPKKVSRIVRSMMRDHQIDIPEIYAVDDFHMTCFTTGEQRGYISICKLENTLVVRKLISNPTKVEVKQFDLTGIGDDQKKISDLATTVFESLCFEVLQDIRKRKLVDEFNNSPEQAVSRLKGFQAKRVGVDLHPAYYDQPTTDEDDSNGYIGFWELENGKVYKGFLYGDIETIIESNASKIDVTYIVVKEQSTFQVDRLYSSNTLIH